MTKGSLAPVSVVIPSYNSGHLIEEAFSSVLLQTTPPQEIIVIDDGSVDDTRRRVAGLHPRVHYHYQVNQGVASARNAGVARASQEFVAFLDADDVWHPRKVELQLEAFARNPELSLLGTGVFDWPAASFPDVSTTTSRVIPLQWSKLVVKNYLALSSIMVRKAALDQAGPFDTDLQGPEDRDLCNRIAEVNQVANLDLPLMGYRDVPGSVSKQAARCQSGMLRALEKLDQRQVWAGRWLLRRKAYSFVYHTVALLYGAAGDYRTSLACSIKSLLLYPFPYSREEVATQAERPKRLLVNLLRSLQLKTPDQSRPAVFAPGKLNALQKIQNIPVPGLVH